MSSQLFGPSFNRKIKTVTLSDLQEVMSTDTIREIERFAAFEHTDNPISRQLLQCFPDLIYHPGPRSAWQIAHCYQDERFDGAIACTAEEADLLRRCVTVSDPKHVLEIGSYIGWSTAHMAFGLTEGSGVWIDAIDSMEEHANPEPIINAFYENMSVSGVSDRVRLIIGRSPNVLPLIAPKHGWDIVFIDGFHRDDQPMRDVVGVLQHTNLSSVIIMHDTWMPDVMKAANYLVDTLGYTRKTFLTGNELSFFYQQEPDWWHLFQLQAPCPVR